MPGKRDTNFTTLPDDQSFQDREDSRTSWCWTDWTIWCLSSAFKFAWAFSLHEFCLEFSMFFCRWAHPSFSCCHWHGSSNTLGWFSRILSFCDGNSEPSASRSQSENHWHSLSLLRHWLRLVGKLQEFAGRAERYKFGDGGTLVSSIRVTAPIFVAGKKGRIVFRARRRSG